MKRHGLPTTLFYGALLIMSTSMAGSLARQARAVDEPIQLDSGQISGSRAGDDGAIRVYKGIPFAAPPVDKLRWQPPQAVAAWQGVRECNAFGPVCPQQPYPPGSVYVQPPQPQSEDCLFLNVWTGAANDKERRPVMVWIHGGALTRGAGSLSVYDGQALARKGVVLVTINYRLGPFGYISHPVLSQESPHHSSGNYGVLDQIAALEWVQRNIAAFGGDPSRVTIFGESAGSWSVCALVATPLSKGLFQRAIGQSGGCFAPMTHLKQSRPGLPAAEKNGEGFAAILGCDKAPDPLAAMREKSTSEILAAAAKDPAQVRTRACVDGWIFPEEIAAIYASGRQQPVPVMIGSNADEGTSLAAAMVPASIENFQASAKRKFGDLTERFLKLYPTTSESDVRGAFLGSFRDEWFTWEMRTWARLTAKTNGKAYLYYFTRVPPRPDAAKLGAYHAAEIPYVFGNLKILPWMNEPADRELSEAMTDAWVRFATAGDPNGGTLPIWKPFDGQSQPCVEFGTTVRTLTAPLKEECEFYDAYVAAKRAEETR